MGIPTRANILGLTYIPVPLLLAREHGFFKSNVANYQTHTEQGFLDPECRFLHGYRHDGVVGKALLTRI